MSAVLQWFNLSAKARIALGLSSICISLLLVAGLLGLVPDRSALLLDGRAALAEAIAVNSSVFITRADLTRMEANLQLQLERHEELSSAAVRREDGRVMVVAGDHASLWQPEAEFSALTGQVRVPIWEGDQLWGHVELVYTPIRASGWFGYLQEPFVQLLMLVGFFSFVIFYFYLGKMLEQLDPSQAIPDRVRSALDTMAEGLLVVDARRKIVLANEAFASLVGDEPSRLFGKKVSDFAWDSDEVDAEGEETRYPWEVSLAENRVQMGKIIRLPGGDGKMRTFMVNCSPVMGGEGAAAGVMVSFDDVTELEEKEIELRKSKEEAEAANRAKSDFLANMSHEIRTPMNAILGFTEVLKRGFGKNRQESAKYLNTIASSGTHLLGLINDILDLSKVEAGQLQVERIPCTLHQIVHEVIQIMRVKADEKGLQLTYEPVGSLPAKVLSDPARVRQILTNLLGNAIKFTEQGGVTVRTRWLGEGDRVELAVADSGIGMSEAQVAAIFQPFVQADSSITRRFGGTGLGLTISKRFAEALGGDITASSVAGEGSTFTVTLCAPLVADSEWLSEEALAQPLAHEVIDGQVQWAFPAARVLVVDDGAENRNLLDVVLSDVGLQVSLAENGQQALDAVTSGDFDLVLMDVQMPVMDGYQAVGLMRERNIDIPVFALTAHAMAGAEEKCLQADYSGYMTKPIDIERLLATLARLLGGEVVEPPLLTESGEAAAAASATDAGARADATAEASLQPLYSSLPTDNPKLQSIVARFITRLGEQVPAMERAAAQQDWSELAELAHWLKGSGGSVGFADFTQPAADLEIAARAGQADEAAKLLVDVVQLQRRVDLGATSDETAEDSQPSAADNVVPIKAYPAPARIESTLANVNSRFIPIIRKFQQRLQDKLEELEECLERQDFEQVREIAHWLKGSAGSVGYAVFTEPAQDLEAAAKAGDGRLSQAICHSLRELVARVEPVSEVS